MPVAPKLPFRTFRYTLPFPPSVNRYWLKSRRGGKYLSKEAKKFRADVIRLAKASRVPLTNTRRRLAVKISFVMPDDRERDLDNYFKGLFDALQAAGVYQRDSQIDVYERVERLHIAAPGSILIEIREIGHPTSLLK